MDIRWCDGGSLDCSLPCLLSTSVSEFDLFLEDSNHQLLVPLLVIAQFKILNPYC
jgi:hypothetical protein